MKFIKILIASLTLFSFLSIGSAAAVQQGPGGGTPTPANSFDGDACSGLSSISSTGCNQGSDTVKSIAKNVVTVMSIIIGVISVIMILVSGFRFVLAGSDTNAVSGAKNTLIYALVGLAIAVLAQLLVHYVLNESSKIGNSSFLNNSRIVDDA